MRVIYIAGPYRASTPYGVERNIRRAEAMMLLVAELGYVALCPHTMTRYLDGTFSDEYWLEATLELMRRCDAVVLCNGWEHSEGTRGEVAEAERLGLPVHTSYYSLLSATKTETLEN
jgi:hypothetical protein